MKASAGVGGAQTLVEGLDVTLEDAVPDVTLVQEIEVELATEELEIELVQEIEVEFNC